MKRFYMGLLNGLFCLLLALSLSLVVLCSCDWLYRADVRLLDIPQSSGLSEQVVLDNYHAVVGYLAPWNDSEFALQGLPWSDEGREYFRQLRLVVLSFYVLGLLSIIGLICLHDRRKKLGCKIWNISGGVTLALAVIIGVLLAVNFDSFFSSFNQLLFPDGSWEMYEDLDPVVRIFPQSFFLHAAFFAVFAIVAASLLQFAAGYTRPQKVANTDKSKTTAHHTSPYAGIVTPMTVRSHVTAPPAQPQGQTAAQQPAQPAASQPERKVYRRGDQL